MEQLDRSIRNAVLSTSQHSDVTVRLFESDTRVIERARLRVHSTWVSGDTVRGSGSVKPSTLRPRESAQCIRDVINLEPELVGEGEVENRENEVNVLVYCAGRETWRGTRDRMTFLWKAQLEP